MMDTASSYIVTGHVLDIARILWRSAVKDMSEEDFNSKAPSLDEFLPEAVRLFIKRHADIQRLIADQSSSPGGETKTT